MKVLWDKLVHSIHKRDVGKVTEIPLKLLTGWMVDNRIAHDRHNAMVFLTSEVGLLKLQTQGIVTFDEFERLFTKGCLKRALQDVASRYGKKQGQFC